MAKGLQAKGKKSHSPHIFVVLAVVILFGVVVLRNTGTIASEDANIIVTMFGGLVAAYLGASAAIGYQKKKEDEVNRKLEVEAINATILSLTQRVIWLDNTKRNVIDPFRSDPLRHFSIYPWLVSPPAASLGIEKLNSLISSGAETIVLRLANEEVVFDSLVNILKGRNQLHLEFQEQIVKAGFRQGEAVTPKQMADAGMEKVMFHLASATDNFIKLVDSSLEAYIELAEVLKNTAFILYPGMVVLTLIKPSEIARS